MATEKISFLTTLHKYLVYSEAIGQYNQLDEEDRKIINPYINSLNWEWREELECIRLKFGISPLPKIVGKIP